MPAIHLVRVHTASTAVLLQLLSILICAFFLTKQTLVRLFFFQAVRTFTLGNETTPHHLAFLQMASDGVGSLSLNEAFLADHRYGAPQLETVSEAPGVQRYARVGALITPKGL